LSTMFNGAIGIQVRGGGVVVGEIVTSDEAELDIVGEEVIEDDMDGVSVGLGVSDGGMAIVPVK
jgi:hypothetical protein